MTGWKRYQVRWNPGPTSPLVRAVVMTRPALRSGKSTYSAHVHADDRMLVFAAAVNAHSEREAVMRSFAGWQRMIGKWATLERKPPALVTVWEDMTGADHEYPTT